MGLSGTFDNRSLRTKIGTAVLTATVSGGVSAFWWGGSAAIGSIGLAQYTLTGYDASAHMSEETHQASRGAAVGSESIATATSPDTTANSDGALPLYGTWIICTPVIDLNNSPARCVEEPVDPEP